MNKVRIDGASTYNPNLVHMTSINPTLESIEAVDVVTGSFDAEQGLAGGAAVNREQNRRAIHGAVFFEAWPAKPPSQPIKASSGESLLSTIYRAFPSNLRMSLIERLRGGALFGFTMPGHL